MWFAYFIMSKSLSCCFCYSCTGTFRTIITSTALINTRWLIDSCCWLRRFLDDINLLFFCLNCYRSLLLSFILFNHQLIWRWTGITFHLSLHHASWCLIFGIFCHMRGENFNSDSFSCYLWRRLCFDNFHLLLTHIFTIHDCFFA